MAFWLSNKTPTAKNDNLYSCECEQDFYDVVLPLCRPAQQIVFTAKRLPDRSQCFRTANAQVSEFYLLIVSANGLAPWGFSPTKWPALSRGPKSRPGPCSLRALGLRICPRFTGVASNVRAGHQGTSVSIELANILAEELGRVPAGLMRREAASAGARAFSSFAVRRLRGH